jgi:hypothetical protein
MPPDSASTGASPSVRPICASVIDTRVRQFHASCVSSDDCSAFIRASSASCSAPSGVSARRWAIDRFFEHFARVREPRRDGIEHGRARLEFGLLRHVDGHELLLARDQPVVRLREPRDDLQQRRLARTVATDQTDALAGLQREVRVIEQRDVTERELRTGNGIKRHGQTAKREEAPIVPVAHACAGMAGWTMAVSGFLGIGWR